MYYPKQRQLTEILMENPQIDISVFESVSDSIHTLQIFSPEKTRNELLQKYGFMLYPYYSNTETDTIQQGVENFVESWERFFEKNRVNFSRMYAALIAEYNPINNYDMAETESNTDTRGEITKTFTPTAENIISESTTTRENVDSLVTTFDDTTPRLDNRVQNPQTTISTTTNTIGNTETTTQNAPDSGERTLTRSGNIGVTTSQQMIESEINLRRFNFVDYVLSEFVKQHCFFVG